jgi:hypothetical protein
VIDALEALAGLAADTKSYERAARLRGAAHTQRDKTGYQLCLTDRDVDLERVRQALGLERNQAVFDDGKSLSIDEALAYPSRGRGERRRPSTGWESLTPIEQQIVDPSSAGP